MILKDRVDYLVSEEVFRSARIHSLEDQVKELTTRVKKLENSIYYPWNEQNHDGNRLRTDQYNDRLNGVQHRQEKLVARVDELEKH